MSTTQILATALAVLVLLFLGGLAWSRYRRRALRDRFGSEYDRLVAANGSRPAERELRERESRYADLDLTELTPEARAAYTERWRDLQARFVDTPAEAVADADDLVTRLLADRGYPAGDHDERAAYLSVEHAAALGAYREAHGISVRNQRGEAGTEELRTAVLHFRTIVTELLGAPDTDHPTEEERRTHAT